MHFAIPGTQEFVNKSSGSSFTGFNVHINGAFHACLRYKQLHSLHEQLKRSLPNLMPPPFPPKKLFPLTSDQLEDRRASLERYIQLIGQDPIFSKSELLRSFLLTAQQESAAIKSHDVQQFDVYLMNGYRIAVACQATDCSSKVLEKACAAIDLPRDFTYYFALFLMRKDNQGSIVFSRKLMDFEAPSITQRTVGTDYKCVIRKSYWDPCYDNELMRDKVALNLLYIQTVSDVERGWAVANVETKDELASLQSRGNKKEYLEMARNLPNYGTIHFTNCTVDYPERDVNATVTIGNKEITFQTQQTNDPETVQETKFRVTRIRCWKISTIHNPESPENPTLELCFEFLMSKNYLKWIVIRSAQAMLITVCLQSMVNELLNQKSDTNNLKTSQNSLKTGQTISFPKRDETNLFKPVVNGVPLSAAADQDNNQNNNESSGQQQPRNNNTMKQILKEISTTVFFKNNQNRESVHNEAFEDIGDDDL